MSEVMIDLETLGTENDSVILSIGAVKFDIEPFTVLDTFHVGLNLEEQEKVGRKIYASTVKWWLDQSKEAQKSLLVTLNDPWHPSEALDSLRVFCGAANGVWGNGSMFDNALIVSLSNSFGLKSPWSYKLDRCYRTLKSLYPSIEGPERKGVHHNALDDAMWQAEHLSRILELMK